MTAEPARQWKLPPPRSSRSAARMPYPSTIGAGSTTIETTRAITITSTVHGGKPATSPMKKVTMATSSAV